MSVYHAIHESPYADDCPDCTGMEGTEDEQRREWSRWLAIGSAAVLLAIVVLLAVVGRTAR